MEKLDDGSQYFLVQHGTKIRRVSPDRFLNVKDPDVKSMAVHMLEHSETPAIVAIIRDKERPTRLIIPLEVGGAFRSRLVGNIK